MHTLKSATTALWETAPGCAASDAEEGVPGSLPALPLLLVSLENVPCRMNKNI